jgi:hypothetical protein
VTSRARAVWIIGAAILIAACILAAGIVLGRGCSHTPVVIEPIGIDAGPGDRAIATELDAAIQREERHIRELEAEHARELAEFEKAERAEYERIRATGDRHAMARWFGERSRRLLGDAGATRW